MRTQLMILFLFSGFFHNVLGQSKNDYTNLNAKYTFEKRYVKQDYEIFEGKIDVINENTFKLGEKTLLIDNTDKNLREIFRKGIFNPDIVFGKETTKPLSKIQIETLSKEDQTILNLLRNDSLVISSVKELIELNPNPQTKRFSFWLFTKGFSNPTEYYFEIYNRSATKKTNFSDFIIKARMTFFYKGTVII